MSYDSGRQAASALKTALMNNGRMPGSTKTLPSLSVIANNYRPPLITARPKPNPLASLFPPNQHAGTLARQGKPHPPTGAPPASKFPLLPAVKKTASLARNLIKGGGVKLPVKTTNAAGHPVGTSGTGSVTMDTAPSSTVSRSTKSTVDPLLTQAQETISAQMDPQLADLQNQINNAVTGGQQQVSDLGELYRRAGIQIGANQSAGDAANAAAQTAIGGNYDKLNQALGQIYGGAANATGNELQRLGIQAVAPQALAGQQRDQNYLTGLAGIDRSNALGNSTAKGQSFDNLMGILSSQTQLSGADKTAAAMAAARQTISDLSNKKGTLAATRKSAVDALYRQLSTAQTQKQADLAQQNFMNQIALGKLGVSQGQLSVAARNAATNASKAANAAGIANALLPYNQNLKTAQTESALHAANAPYKTSTSTTNLKGYGGGLSLLNSVKTNAASKSALGTALNLYKYYYGKYGKDAMTKILAHSGGGDPNFMALPPDLKGALQDAFKVAAK